MTSTAPAQVTVYWRPGCGFCSALRSELDRAGIDRTEVNIWEDSEAAALVRSVASGNETVPTVVIGGRAFINPSAREVLAAVSDGHDLPAPAMRASHRSAGAAVVGWSLAAGMGWLVLALTHPTTTYHLAPLLTSMASAVAVAGRQDHAVPGRVGVLTVTAGTLVASAVLVILGLAGALAGPALVGSSAATESVVMIVAGTLIGGAGLWSRRARERVHPDAAAASRTRSTDG